MTSKGTQQEKHDTDRKHNYHLEKWKWFYHIIILSKQHDSVMLNITLIKNRTCENHNRNHLMYSRYMKL